MKKVTAGCSASRPRSVIARTAGTIYGSTETTFYVLAVYFGSVAIKRTGFYSVDYELLPLDAVAGKTRVMEDEFISASGKNAAIGSVW